MLPIVLIAIGAAGAAVSGAIGTGVSHKIKSGKAQKDADILSGGSSDYPKVLICGASKTGKSSLVNTVLEAKVARIGAGETVTRGICEYSSEIQKLCICECEGYTVRNLNEYRQRVNTFLKKNRVNKVWYCVNAGTKRLLETDEDNIKQLIKLIGEDLIDIVITKTDTASKQELDELTASIIDVFPALRIVTYSNDPALSKQAEYSVKQLTEKLAPIQ